MAFSDTSPGEAASGQPMPRVPRCHGIRADSPDPGQMIGISIGIAGGNPEIPGPANSGSGQNPGDSPGQAKSAKSGFNPGKSGKIPISWTAKTVIADCQRQARLVWFLVGVGKFLRSAVTTLLPLRQ